MGFEVATLFLADEAFSCDDVLAVPEGQRLRTGDPGLDVAVTVAPHRR